jgi:hypothetical protein
MSKFIKPEDYDASIHAEILDRLTRSDESIVEICEDRAIAEMRSSGGALSAVDPMSPAAGHDRHPLVLMMAIDITVYHLFSIHNPQKISQVRVDRYERAVEWLKQVAKRQVSVDGAPVLDTQKQQSPWLMHSNPKRHNHL